MSARPLVLALAAGLALAGPLAPGPAAAQTKADAKALLESKVRVSIPHSKIFKGVSNDNGKHIVVEWDPPVLAGDQSLVFRTADPQARPAAIDAVIGRKPTVKDKVGPWTLVAVSDDAMFVDEVEPGAEYRYLVATAAPSLFDVDVIGAVSGVLESDFIAPEGAFFNVDRWFFLVIVVLMTVALLTYIRIVRKRPEDVFIRRIAGVDAIEEAVGRSTEMGRPVLYVTGVEEIQDIQTIASLLILGHVAEMTAEYDTEIKVANFFPLTMVVAEEIVRQGFANAGRIDAHKPENVMFISAEQFAFAAGVNGLILRDRPATNIYLGRFFAESLILAETGYVTQAIQIAGTAEITQLPFFIAACDYTVIGEELYAVGAYLSREPSLLAMLKSADALKLLIMALIFVGAATATAGWVVLGPWLVP